MFTLVIWLSFNLISSSLQVPTTRVDDGVPGRKALDNFPLVDGHNDLPWNLFAKLNNQLEKFNFQSDLSNDALFGFEACSSCFTDLSRAKAGKLGAQFWAAYVSCGTSNYNKVSQSFEQVDVIKRLVNKYVDDMEFVETAAGIEDAFKRGKIASLIGLEGGHSIDNRLSLLRQFYDVGVRYMTLTHSCNLRWADASPVDDTNSVLNLTDFGEKMVLEMNRLGMLVDLSHVSYGVMKRALEVSLAPVIFSHSSAYAVFPHHRNVKDDILKMVAKNRGVVMVNFYSAYVAVNATIDDVITHINHIADVAGVDYVGIGSDYDGVNRVPIGLEDVSKFPDLFDLLKEKNPEIWTIENLEKLAGRNLVRAFTEAENIRDSLKNKQPDDSFLPEEEKIPDSSGSSATGLTAQFLFLSLIGLCLMHV